MKNYIFIDSKMHRARTRFISIKKGTKIGASWDLLSIYDDMNITPSILWVEGGTDTSIGTYKKDLPFFSASTGKLSVRVANEFWGYVKDMEWNWCYGTYEENILLHEGKKVTLSDTEFCLLPEMYTKRIKISSGFFTKNV